MSEEEQQSDSDTLEVAEGTAAGPWALEAEGPAGISRVELDGCHELVLGSGQAAQLRLADPAISARHLRVRVLPCGVQLEDLHSKNGLFVGAARVECALLTRPDTRFVIGHTTLTLRKIGEVCGYFEAVVPGLVGSSPAMRRLGEAITRYAPLSAPVLIEGESGTGKDLVARALHKLSRRKGAYVPINCSSLTEGLADSELFGHCRGAFTGAVAQRTGAFQHAHQGTLFLDEIAELAPAVQGKLLRVIEDGEVRPVGSASATQVTTRLVTATWQSLAEAAELRQFRADLLHRIGMVVLQVPPLRQRKSDIPALSSVLLRRMANDVGEKVLTRGSLERLYEYGWPGNVRELRSVLYRAAVGCEGPEIDQAQIERAIPERTSVRPNGLSAEQARALLSEAAGNVSRAARTARVARSTFRSWLARTDDGRGEPISGAAGEACDVGPMARTRSALG